MRVSELERLSASQGKIVRGRARVDGQLRELALPSAIPDSEIDHFERDDLDHYSGDTGDYNINSDSPVLFDDRSLKGSNGESQIISTSGLPNYPEQGDRIWFYINQDGNGPNAGFLWGVQNSSDFYILRFQGLGELRFDKDSNADNEIENMDDFNTDSDTWYLIEIDWFDDGDITISIFDVNQSTGDKEDELDSMTVNDTDYNDGGIGWFIRSSSGEARFDNASLLKGGAGSD